MSPPAADASLRGDVLGALNGAASTFAIAIASATLIFAPLGPRQLGAALVACMVAAVAGGLMAAVLSSTPLSVSAPRAAVSIAIAALAAHLLREAPEAAPALVIAAVCAGVLLAGLFQALAGAARLGQLVRFVPFPVVAGFTHGIALTLLIAYFPLLLGATELPRLAWPQSLELRPWAALLGVATLAAVFGIARGWPRAPAVFAGLLVGLLCAWAVQRLHPGADLGTTLSTRDLAFPRSPALDGAALATFIEQAGGWARWVTFSAAIAVVASIDALVGAMAIETRYVMRSRPDRDLVAQGLGNTLSGMLGGAAITYGAVQVQAAHAGGARRRLASLLSPPFVLAIAVAGASVVAAVPLSVLAAMMVFFAVRIADPWGFAIWNAAFGPAAQREAGARLTWLVYFSVAISIVLLDIVAAVAVGVAASAALFVRTMNQHVVRGVYRGASVRSRRLYPQPLDGRLDALMDRVAVVELQGPFFFGTADRIVEEVARLPQATRYVVLDLRRVPALDATAKVVLGRLRARMAAERREVIVSGTPAGLLPAGGALPATFADRDRAMEWVEDRLLEAEGADITAGDLPREAFGAFIGADAAQREALATYCTVHELAARDAIFRFGEASHALYFLLAGRVTIQYESGADTIRLVTLLPGNVFGHVAFVDGKPRSADALCDVPSRVLVLHQDALLRMELEHPALASRLHAMAARDIANRLRATDRIVREVF